VLFRQGQTHSLKNPSRQVVLLMFCFYTFKAPVTI